MTTEIDYTPLSEYTLDEIVEFLMSEEYAQLDELSKSTLGDYIQKASDSKARAFHKASTATSDKERDKAINTLGNRKKGIAIAVKKLTEAQPAEPVVESVESLASKFLTEYHLEFIDVSIAECSDPLVGSVGKMLRESSTYDFSKHEVDHSDWRSTATHKGIPIKHLDEFRAKAKAAGTHKDFRIVYRGPRGKHKGPDGRPQSNSSTLKKDAHSFDVYHNTYESVTEEFVALDVE